jgi:DHA1 family bicyclomycin/chloramphenicol resistance-like MFS transporter
MMATLIALTAMAIDTMLPAFPAIRDHFGLAVGSTATAPLVTWFFLGFAISQLAYGPLADRFGRKPTLYLGLGIFVAAAIWSAFAPTLTALYVARFFWGLGAAGPRVVVMSIIRDRFEGDDMAKVLSLIMGVFILVPVAAPTLGAALVARFSWQSVFWFPGAMAIVASLWSIRLVETLNPDDKLELAPSKIWRAGREVVVHKAAFSFTLAAGFSTAVLLTWLSVAELVIGDVFDRMDIFPYVFGGTAALSGAAMFNNGKLMDWLTLRGLIRKAGFLFVASGAVAFGVALATGGAPSMWVFLAPQAVQFAAYGLLGPNLNTVAMQPLGHIAGTAAAVVGAVSIAIGVALSSLATAAFDGGLTSVGASLFLFSFLTLLFVIRGLNASEPIAQ